MNIEDDPFLERFLDTPEKRAKWIYRIRIAYILWIIFVVFGISFLLFYYVLT